MKRGTFYRDAAGNEIEEHEAFENGILKDGITVSIPKTMRDASSKRTVKPRATRIFDGFGNAAGRRPGHIAQAVSDQVARQRRQMRDQAYNDYEARVTNQWRNQANDDDGVDYNEGAACTVKGSEYPDDYGAPGHIRNGVCVPDSNQSDAVSIRDASRDHRKIMDDVYRASDARLSSAWRRS